MVRSRRSAGLTLVLFGCGPGAGDIPQTEQLYAEMFMIARTADQTDGIVKITDLQDQLVGLPQTDHVTVTVPGWVVELVAPIRATDPVYSAPIPVAAGGETYTVTVKRTYARNAPFSQVVMPEGLELVIEAETVARSTEDLVLTWEPFGQVQPMTLNVEGGCIDDLELPVHNDPGIYTLEAGMLVSALGMESESCPIEVELRRFDYGTVDKTWRDGVIEARQTRALWVETTP